MSYSVYVFLDTKNRPYYVGKTNNMKRRRKEHLKEIAEGNTLPKYNKARALIRKGLSLKMRRIRSTDSENKAYKLERYFIKKYRNAGYKLMNCTWGGPHENPCRINTPKKTRHVGIKLPKLKKKSFAVKKRKRRKIKKARKR